MEPRRPKTLSLRAKIVLILSAVVVAYALTDHLIQQMLVQRSFEALEEARGLREIRRVLSAIEAEAEHLDERCREWGSREDVWRFAAEGDPSFERWNLSEQALERSGLDVLILCALPEKVDVRADRKQELMRRSGMPRRDQDLHSPGGHVSDGEREVVVPVLWSRVRDADGRPLELRDFPAGALAPQHPLIVAHDPEPGEAARALASGILMTEAGPLLVASRPIRGADGSAGRRGTVILGRFLAGELLERMVDRTLVDIDLWNLDDHSIPEEEREVLDQVTASSEPVIVVRDGQPMHVYATLGDIRHAPIVLARVDVPREISARGATATRYALLSTFAAGLLILLVLLQVLQRTVIEPIGRLTSHAVEIGRSEDFSRKLGLGRDDEIGILSREFDAMMEKLAQSRAAVVKAARAAGMSEIATGVLHNVGNVLNSVNVSASIVADRTRKSAAQDLKRAIDLVRESAGDLATFVERDPRGRHLYPLLCSLTDKLAEEQHAIGREVESLEEGIEHIKELIHAQQGYAGRSGVLENVRLSEQVEHALSITAQTVRGAAVEIEREYEDLGPIPVDRHRLIEILVNLAQNARQSLQEPEVAVRKLVVRVAATATDSVRIEIADTGVGIAPEDLARVFTHGFTTKKTGHGFGLHSSANAAREMGGNLWAESEGRGRGARFVLELPLRRQALAEVAG